MINNKQVNLWRGDDVPPTIYHVWIYKNEQILLYNGSEWVTFVNDADTTNKIIELQNQINKLNDDVLNVSNKVDKVVNSTINNKLITDNPVLSGIDLLTEQSGNFIKSENTVSDNIKKLDTVLTTLIIQ